MTRLRTALAFTLLALLAVPTLVAEPIDGLISGWGSIPDRMDHRAEGPLFLVEPESSKPVTTLYRGRPPQPRHQAASPSRGGLSTGEIVMGEDTIQGLSEALWERFSAHLAESAIDQIPTKADIEGLAKRADLEVLATKAEVNGLAQRVGELEKTVKGSNPGSVARPLLWAGWGKLGRVAQAGALIIGGSLSLALLGLVVILLLGSLQAAGVPIGEVLSSLRR